MAVSELALKRALREELTSGDGNVRALLTQLILSAVLKDSAGAELSDHIRNIDIPLSRIPLGELCLIPAYYNVYTMLVHAFARQSGGTFGFDDRSITGTYWYSSTAGSYIEFEFYGTWFDVVFFAKSGVANIYVDDTMIATVGVSTLRGPGNNLVWHGPRNLSDDYHTVRIEVVSGIVYVVGIMVDPAKNAWRIRPFPQTLDRNLYGLHYYGTSAFGLYVRGYTTGHPVFSEKWPAYRTAVSTTTALAAGGSWTSASVDCLGARPYAKRIHVTLYSNVDGTLFIEYSPDNTNWDSVESFPYTGGTTPVIGPIEVKGRYARLRYVNNPTTAQTVFRLYAWFMAE